MKCPKRDVGLRCAHTSPPARGAWIEMPAYEDTQVEARKSPPARGAWIEMSVGNDEYVRGIMSPPARGAWIEIGR